MKEKLDLIEARLQALIEGSLSWLFSTGDPRRNLARQLVESMQSNLLTVKDGRLVAPNIYELHIHPSRQPFWQSNQPVLNDLARVLYQAGREAGFDFSGLPRLQVAMDPEISPQDIRVTSFPGRVSIGETASLPALPTSAPNPITTPTIPPGAFLIVDGNRHYPLLLPVINIGRRPDNHLVIDDPRVSRTHAQIRAIKGRFVLFDLNSTGGTFINYQPVNQHPLSAGDVISLAGYTLIYGQDTADAGPEATNVMPVQPPRPGGSTPKPSKP